MENRKDEDDEEDLSSCLVVIGQRVGVGSGVLVCVHENERVVLWVGG